jgi:hypothetical protein
MKTTRMIWPLGLLLVLTALLVSGPAQGKNGPAGLGIAGPGQGYAASVPVIDLGDFGYRPVQLPAAGPASGPEVQAGLPLGAGSDPHNPYAVIRHTGPTFLQPGGVARYEIGLANYESVTHTYRLTTTLPPQLVYLPDSASGLDYDPAMHRLTWQGALAPGRLAYLIEPTAPALPYLDLAGFGLGNLCDAFTTNGQSCADTAVTFNLGSNGYTAQLYGERVSQLTVSTNGLILGHEPVTGGHNRRLPDAAAPGPILAGLWRAVDFTAGGRWHAAILSGFIAGHDVFYAQWHDAPHAANANLTARHAIAVVLDGAHLPDAALSGHAFFIYDNVAHPAQTVAHGYTIGVGDKLGLRGATYAYAPCCGDGLPPQGYPPPAGTTLQLRPVLLGAGNEYRRLFSYAAIVYGQVPETVVTTAVVASSSPDPDLAYAWSTHYLYLRRQTYLPLLRVDEVGP